MEFYQVTVYGDYHYSKVFRTVKACRRWAFSVAKDHGWLSFNVKIKKVKWVEVDA